jgi:glycosyltransferase involved in cell wall biosynthesis
MNILLVSGFRIFPTSTGGHIRSGSIARALARLGHQVLIYSLAGRRGDYGFRTMFQRTHRVDDIEANLSEETNLGLGYGLLQAVGHRCDWPRVWQYALMRRGIVPSRLRSALMRADIVIGDMPWCPPVPEHGVDRPWYLLSHNLEHRLLEQGNPPHRRFATWMKKIESDAPQTYRDILACAEEDREFFREHDLKRHSKVPLLRGGVDPKAYAAPAGERARIRAGFGLGEADRLLVFAGSGFAPNREALAELGKFCAAEADFLERERLFFLILGSITPAAYRKGALIATGRVPEVAPYFAAADAGLNPVTRGSGANVKLFEYVAAKLPVISTTFGVRGSMLKAEIDYLAYAPQTFKAVLERFLRERTPAQWRAHAHEVWERHKGTCDIEILVRDALSQLPGINVEEDAP